MTARERLAAVLGRHRMIGFNDTDARCMACNWVSNGHPETWDDHLAAAVLDHLATELGSDDMRETVDGSMREALHVAGWNYGTAEEMTDDSIDAALGAVRAALGVGEA